MSSIRKVAVLGASGTLGQSIIPALLQSGFEVTVISRFGGHGYTLPTNEESNTQSVSVVEAAYDDIASLTTAFRNQDAIIEAFNPAAMVHKKTIVTAALSAGVKQLVTNEFGFDTFHRNASRLPVATYKIEAQRVLEGELLKAAVDGKSAPLAWTAIITNTWYDFAIKAGFFWLNPAKREITRFGSGDQKTSLSRMALNGEAVVAVLREPELFRNRPVYIASDTVTTNELIAIANEDPDNAGSPWTVVDIPDVEAFRMQGMTLWEDDRKNGKDWLHSQAFMMLGAVGLFDENNHFGADFGDKLEPGWGDGRERFTAHLRQLIKEGSE